MKTIYGIAPQTQPTGSTCVQTCLAMALGVPVAEVIDRYGKRPMNQQLLEVALTECDFVWNHMTKGTMVFDGWYFAVVPSLNIRGGTHQILIRFARGEGVTVLDPAIAETYKQDGSDLRSWADLNPFWIGSGKLPSRQSEP